MLNSSEKEKNNERNEMFKPFEHGNESSAIYDLTLENQVDCVSLYGNLQITKDQVGLQAAESYKFYE
jgi:hypothetical protein